MDREWTQRKVERVQNLTKLRKRKTPQVGQLQLRLRIQAQSPHFVASFRFVSHQLFSSHNKKRTKKEAYASSF